MSLPKRTVTLSSPEIEVTKAVFVTETLDPQATVMMRGYDEDAHEDVTMVARMPMDRVRDLAAALNRMVGAEVLD